MTDNHILFLSNRFDELSVFRFLRLYNYIKEKPEFSITWYYNTDSEIVEIPRAMHSIPYGVIRKIDFHREMNNFMLNPCVYFYKWGKNQDVYCNIITCVYLKFVRENPNISGMIWYIEPDVYIKDYDVFFKERPGLSVFNTADDFNDNIADRIIGGEHYMSLTFDCDELLKKEYLSKGYLSASSCTRDFLSDLLNFCVYNNITFSEEYLFPTFARYAGYPVNNIRGMWRWRPDYSENDIKKYPEINMFHSVKYITESEKHDNIILYNSIHKFYV